MSGPVVRRLGSADLDAVRAVLLGAYADHLVAESDYVRVLTDVAGRDREAEVWLAVDEADGKVLGTVTVCPPGSPYREIGRDGEGEFRMLAVDPAARGRGVGRLLTQHVVDDARRRGLTAVVLCSTPTMRAAHRLYESMGFVRLPDRDWSPDEHVDLLAYRLEL